MVTQAFSRIKPLFKYSSERDCMSLSYSEMFGYYYYYLPRDVSYVADGSWCGDGKMCLNQSCVPLPEGCPHNCSGKPMNDSNNPEIRPGVVYQERNRNRQFRKPLEMFDFFYRRFIEVLPSVIMIIIVIDLITIAGYYFLHPYFNTRRKLPIRSAIPLDSYPRQSAESNISRDFFYQSPPTAWHLD
ncbi:uncharacterized protein LOC141850341 [Brevipalpus obovatus]|uniref:uncharacterized protein LOC141850341 n=1 Tax=Brevipalpus obovatus TaxID=246614 RepID=UPI003D9EF0A8